MKKDELYLEGAKAVAEAAPSDGYTITFIYGPAPVVDKNAVQWSRLREQPFASREEAWHWLHANAERMLRERVLAVRVLRVVEQRVPQLIAMFHEATPEQVADVLPKKEKGRKPASMYDVPGDEWKNGGDE